MERDVYDVIILGGGPAGLTAALYCGRYGLKTLVIAKEIGGTTSLAPEIENWPGLICTGKELSKRFREHAEKFEAIIKEETILSVFKKENLFEVETEKNKFYSKTIIICLGTQHKKLEIKGEEEFLGKGVSYCPTCDGNFFKNKTVGVIGGANSAATAALYLSKIAKKVYIIYRRDKMRCEAILLNRLKEEQNVFFFYNSIPLEIIGDKKVKKLKILENNKEKYLDLDGVFIQIGAKPNLDVLKNLGLDVNEQDYIKTNKKMETNLEGVFACGDITDNPFKQITTAVGEGAVAASSVQEFILRK
ncbi:MAG: thioredoxin-disulfide reductase [Candidatus Pacearchaeota archaeon]